MGQLEQRTVTKVGSGSLMVCLPLGWARFHNLKAGDKVQVVTNGEIRIRPLRRPRRRADDPSHRRDSEGISVGEHHG